MVRAALLITASVAAGAVRGVFTLTEATLVADYWGRTGTPSSMASSTRRCWPPGRSPPGIGAGIAALTGSYPALFAILAAAGAGGAALAATAPSPARDEGSWSGGGPEARCEQADPAG